MEELVVTETSFPDRIGANTERRGSALCLMLKILVKVSRKYLYINLVSERPYFRCAALWSGHKTRILSPWISAKMRRELGFNSLRWLNRNDYIAGQICYSRNCKDCKQASVFTQNLGSSGGVQEHVRHTGFLRRLNLQRQRCCRHIVALMLLGPQRMRRGRVSFLKEKSHSEMPL
jgi:hypothetical protein